MSQEVFIGDVFGTATRYGKNVYAKSGEDIKPGLLVTITSGSTVAKAGADDAPWGVAYGARHQVYRPTSKTFADDEELVVLMGDVWAVYSGDFFVGGSVPSLDTTLYSAANGLLDTSGSNKVGRVVAEADRIEEVAGVGSSQDCVLVQLELKP